MKYFTIVLMGVLALGMSGCMETKEVPSCADVQVEKMLKEIYAKHIKETGSANIIAQMFLASVPKQILKLDSARAVAYDDKIMLRSCKAEATLEGNVTTAIEYSVQLDEKNKEQMYVELKLDFLEGLMQQGMMNQLMNDDK